ncbi:hypothetical protein SCHPADRAFT_692772 [Schizopora paradoxa]|uniref:Uncharacterized protein n=1 Tax=Schizopora paradoxa TaxID=27342 RepID=A0A0H2RA27_9AGAM|nr:hypothetical protein SCHPADRAFT_692772 [Schizopora paradoxa]
MALWGQGMGRWQRGGFVGTPARPFSKSFFLPFSTPSYLWVIASSKMRLLVLPSPTPISSPSNQHALLITHQPLRCTIFFRSHTHEVPPSVISLSRGRCLSPSCPPCSIPVLVYIVSVSFRTLRIRLVGTPTQIYPSIRYLPHTPMYTHCNCIHTHAHALSFPDTVSPPAAAVAAAAHYDTHFFFFVSFSLSFPHSPLFPFCICISIRSSFSTIVSHRDWRGHF